MSKTSALYELTCLRMMIQISRTLAAGLEPVRHKTWQCISTSSWSNCDPSLWVKEQVAVHFIITFVQLQHSRRGAYPLTLRTMTETEAMTGRVESGEEEALSQAGQEAP